jgi:predicted phage terminase large subunit-like protein
MTRWSTKDLAGRAIDFYARVGTPIRHINLKALQEDGTMLCDEVLDKASFESKKDAIGADIVSANYQQEPLDAQGRLYKGFKTYKDVPRDTHGNVAFERICCYCDTADKGNDYLALIIFGEYNKQAYVLDVYFTKEGMEVTEPEMAKRLYDWKVNVCYCESNNGGRGFGRSVERILREKYKWHKTSIDLFFQSKNKKARILGAATWVQENVFFPEGWDFKFNEFYKDLMQYTKEGKAKHDDAEDALSGIYDKIGRGTVFSWD